jgi:hypothetical protein
LKGITVPGERDKTGGMGGKRPFFAPKRAKTDLYVKQTGEQQQIYDRTENKLT